MMPIEKRPKPILKSEDARRFLQSEKDKEEKLRKYLERSKELNKNKSN